MYYPSYDLVTLVFTAFLDFDFLSVANMPLVYLSYSSNKNSTRLVSFTNAFGTELRSTALSNAWCSVLPIHAALYVTQQ